MKTINFVFFLLFSAAFSLSAQQQKVIENAYPLPSGKKVEINLKFASFIKVTGWSRNEVGLKTTIQVSEERLYDIHQFKVKETGDLLSIETDYDTKGLEKNNKYNCWSCDEEGKADSKDCICLKVTYELMLPKEAVTNLETISGNIEIREVDGILKAKSISGFLDLGLPSEAQKDLHFKSVTGEIYTDFDLKLDDDSSPWSKKLNTSLNNGGAMVSLETVSGDIYFRKE